MTEAEIRSRGLFYSINEWPLDGGREVICCIQYTLKSDIDDVIRFLHASAAATLPAGTRYELLKSCPGDYGRRPSLAWHHISTFSDADKWSESFKAYIPERNVYLEGQFVTPTNSESGNGMVNQ